MAYKFLTDAQLKAEIARCEYCEEKPCKTACPSDCSPADFIMAAKLGNPSDYKRAAKMILGSNPLGGVCGVVCPDYHCMRACSREKFDRPVNIPAIQATIIEKAKVLNKLPKFYSLDRNGKKVAVIGAGPAGVAAAATLTQKGYLVDIYDENDTVGGACVLIPESRLPKTVTETDIDFLQQTFGFNIRLNQKIANPEELLNQGYSAVINGVGLTEPVRLNIPGDENCIYGAEFLRTKDISLVKGKKIALVGGAIAADQALLAKELGAAYVEMIVLESFKEMPLTPEEKDVLLDAGVQVSNRTRISEIVSENGKLTGIKTKRVVLPEGEEFHPAKIKDEANSTENYRPFDLVIIAVGNRPSIKVEKNLKKGLFSVGDMANGPTTVVEAAASGKNVALQADAYINGDTKPEFENPVKSYHTLNKRNDLPVSLKTKFFGRIINSPFLLSAAPPTDGYEQMKLAYEAGWAGGIMKTAFDDVEIHIPGEYMFVYNDKTYANCDNVSDHPISRVSEEIKKLIVEYPDRLTMASTGGPVTGNDEEDKAGWQSNTKKLEAAGAMGIEYSLSCPQGGDGTHGDIVSQNAELTAKIIDWVMQISDPEVPKLFKLTGAVTAIQPIIDAIKGVLDRYPNKKAGVTLANTFPTLAFRQENENDKWEKGIVAGMSGEGTLAISYLTIANAAPRGVAISGNGGPMDYKAAADFLALGAETVQFCTIAEKYGLGIIDELCNGLSYLLEERGFTSVSDLIACIQPNPITGFMELPPKSKVPEVNEDLCVNCGNCTRCPYLAIKLNEDKIPVIDEDLCVGCSLCVQRCFAGALSMQLVEK